MKNNLSKTSKLDGVLSWSLQAGAPSAGGTCSGSVTEDGALVPACSGCYATTGCYSFRDTKRVRIENKEAWKDPEWVPEMIRALSKSKYFRWFDSGDVYSLELAEKIYAVMVGTPNVKHWIPTRMGKFAKFYPILSAMARLPNVMVRFSSDSVLGEYTPGLHGSTILPSASDASDNVFVCRAYENDGKCSGCRACYSKDIPVIGYVQHGRKMAKVIRLAVA